ncbi:membrane alanyl aminopeptidase-like [Anticarsia gemmatalis]|uniref:membrane alanyl aminopeptidase-like n=1 Tax=Anticarsia gemmatalis TaxID=129554 RepID=UPI003F75833E
MSKIFISALSFMLLASAIADHPLSWYRDMEEATIDDESYARSTETAYRLPENVVPLEFDIYIDLYFAERTEKPFSYEGRENIIIQAVEDGVTQIVLHANVDSINIVSVFDDTGAPVRLNPLQPFETEPLYHFLKINLAQSLTKDAKYTLYIDYSGTMNEGPMKRGIWRGWYEDGNGTERIYATTHFQPYNARQAFPCWDEPLFKSVFKIHLTKPASYSGTFSNTRLGSSTTLPNNRVRDDFLETPKMSAYLVTFLVSETFQSIAEDLSYTPPIRIIGRSNTAGMADHALNLAVKMTDFFDEYFGIPYASLHPNLLNDHISSPDWASAGTENWGMVSYRELYLILDPNETIMSIEHYAATLVSHELAHKWFGNLITCFWWSNTWINEGYASYFGYIATNQMFPEYELDDHFNTRYLQTSLAFDSGVNTVPLNHPYVNTPAQVTGHFGTISYSKAAAFLRMTANIISLETFRKSCKYFLENNAYEPTDQHDLLAAFNQAINEDQSLSAYSNFVFAEYYRMWVNEPGYPLLNVVIDHSTGNIELSQRRFFLNAPGVSTDQIFPIPITYSTKRNPNFTNLRPVRMMTFRTDTLNKDAGEEWVIFNNLQQGHYRVNYDDTTWRLIAEALLNTPDEIHYLSRGQIVDDVFALMRSDRMSYSFGFNILRFLEKESNFHVWDPAISGLTWLRNRLRHMPAKQAEFDNFVLGQMEHAITTLGFEPAAGETPTTTMARQSILQFACTLGHVRCIQDSWDRFVDWRDNSNPVNSRVRRNVYMTAMREGDQNDFQFLLNRYRESNFANDQLEMLRGMGASTNPELLTRYLSLTLTKEVRSHDKLNSFNYALLGNKENAITVLQFVKNNIDQIRVAYVEDSPARPVHNALSNLATYLDEPELVEYEEWLRSTQTSSLQYATAISSINSARNNMAWGTANADVILSAIRSSAATTAASIAMLVTMAGFVMLA